MAIKYPHIKVNLSDCSGNAFMIVGKVGREMRNSGVHNDAIEYFIQDASKGDFDDLLQTCMQWVNIE